MQIVSALDGSLTSRDLEALNAAVKREELAVIPTDTVYGIASVPFAPAAVERLQSAKGRGEDFPPPVLISGTEELERLMAKPGSMGMSLSAFGAAKRLARAFWPGALTMIVKADSSLGWNLGATHGTIALRQPNHPVALEILRHTGPLAVTSANKHTQPPATNIDAAKAYFWDKVAVYVDAGESPSGRPSTIVNLAGSEPSLVREGDIPYADITAALA